MKNISILVTQNAQIAAVENTRNMFKKVNTLLTESGKESFYNITLVGSRKEIKLDGGLFTILIDKELEEIEKTDLIIIPPMSGNMQSSIELNIEYIPWLKQKYTSGAEITSLCGGSFLLAETGLVDGKDCSISIHWQSANKFKSKYPNINLVDEKIITDNNGIYTVGGANSYRNILIYLIEKHLNRDIAIRTSKYFEVALNRVSHFPFMIFKGKKFHDDEIVTRSQIFIEEEYSAKITIEDLAQMANLSRRTFQRRFKKATDFNVAQYIRIIKIEAAKKHLESGKLTINEVMFEVGYTDPKAFRETFKKLAGVTPIHYRQRYS